LIAFEAEAKGWGYHAEVQLSNGDRVRVAFCDPFVLTQDLERGEPCVAIPGMIVVPKVTLEHKRRAVRLLSEGDFFYELQSLKVTGLKAQGCAARPKDPQHEPVSPTPSEQTA
jgi:hypothetical protein